MVWRLWIAQRGAGVDQVMVVVLKRVVRGWLWAGGVVSRQTQLGSMRLIRRSRSRLQSRRVLTSAESSTTSPDSCRSMWCS
jgi:hypothetical protein